NVVAQGDPGVVAHPADSDPIHLVAALATPGRRLARRRGQELLERGQVLDAGLASIALGELRGVADLAYGVEPHPARRRQLRRPHPDARDVPPPERLGHGAGPDGVGDRLRDEHAPIVARSARSPRRVGIPFDAPRVPAYPRAIASGRGRATYGLRARW